MKLLKVIKLYFDILNRKTIKPITNRIIKGNNKSAIRHLLLFGQQSSYLTF